MKLMGVVVEVEFEAPGLEFKVSHQPGHLPRMPRNLASSGTSHVVASLE